MATDTLTGLQWLALVRPGVNAPAEMVADWHEAKAEILDELGYYEDAFVARAYAVGLTDPVPMGAVVR